MTKKSPRRITRSWTRVLNGYRYLPQVFNCMARVQNWGYVLPAYLGLRQFDRQHNFVTKSGINIVCETPGDLITAWIIFVRNEYRLAPDFKTVLDVGANIGVFTLFAAEKLPEATIVAIEPIPATLQVLRRNIVLNRQCIEGLEQRVTVLPFGVASESGTRRIVAASNSAYSSFFPGFVRSEGQDGQSIEVRTSTLEDLINHYFPGGVDLVKMDCEGAEHGAILASSMDVLGKIRTIAMEYHPVAPFALTLSHLRNAGFRVASHIRHGENFGTICLTR